MPKLHMKKLSQFPYPYEKIFKFPKFHCTSIYCFQYSNIILCNSNKFGNYLKLQCYLHIVTTKNPKAKYLDFSKYDKHFYCQS